MLPASMNAIFLADESELIGLKLDAENGTAAYLLSAKCGAPISFLPFAYAPMIFATSLSPESMQKIGGEMI